MDDVSPTNPLERALLDATRGGDPEPLFERLAHDELYVPAQGDAPAGSPGADRPLAADEEIALPVFEHAGERYVAAFTSERRLRDGAPQVARSVRATGADLAAVWPPGHHLALNPGTELSAAIDEHDVRALAGGHELHGRQEATVGAPDREPEELWERLRAWAGGQPEVRAAYRALVLVHAAGEEPRLVVALDLAPDADPGRLLQAGADALGGEAAFTLLDRSGDDPLSGWMLAQSQAIYAREASV